MPKRQLHIVKKRNATTRSSNTLKYAVALMLTATWNSSSQSNQVMGFVSPTGTILQRKPTNSRDEKERSYHAIVGMSSRDETFEVRRSVPKKSPQKASKNARPRGRPPKTALSSSTANDSNMTRKGRPSGVKKKVVATGGSKANGKLAGKTKKAKTKGKNKQKVNVATTTAGTRSVKAKKQGSGGDRRRSKTKMTVEPQSTMLDHPILTKDEEQDLGRRLSRAMKLKDKISKLVLKQQGRDFFESEQAFADMWVKHHVNNNNHPQEEGIGNNHMAIYGSSTSRAMEGSRYWFEDSPIFMQDPGDELYFKDGTLFTGQDYLAEAQTKLSIHQPIFPALLSHGQESVKTFFESGDPLKDIPGGDTLTDDDIRNHLKLQGGRQELHYILVEGALARDQLVGSNIRLVVSIALSWSKNAYGPSQITGASSSSSKNFHWMTDLYRGDWTRPSLEEAVQEGVLGLAKATEKFEFDRGLRFSTYATFWITNNVRRCFLNAATGCLNIPHAFFDIRRAYQKAVKSHLTESNQLPSIGVLADEIGVTESRLQTALRATRPLVSIDEPLNFANTGGGGKAGGDSGTESDVTLSDTLSCDEPQPEDQVERSFLRQCLENAMATELLPHERDVLRLRLGLDDGVTRSVREVVEVCGGALSQRDVRAIEKRAYSKLRSPFAVHTYKLLAYLDFAGADAETLSGR